MQKKIIALAIAGLASTAAFAQSNVTIYGIADAYIGQVRSNGNLTSTVVGSGGLSTSRIGFKGVEDLGNGLKALFALEYRLDIDTNNNIGGDSAKWNSGVGSNSAAGPARQQFVGLTGGFGTAVAGRLQTTAYDWMVKYNPVAATAFDVHNAMTKTGFRINLYADARANNAVAYISPSFGGVTVALNHSFAVEQASSTVASNLAATLVGVYFDQGPLSIGFVGEKLQGGGTLETLERTDLALGASYAFPFAKFFVAGQTTKDNGTNNTANSGFAGKTDTVYSLGAAIPVSAKGTVLVQYAHSNYKSGSTSANLSADNSGKGVSIAYTHDLSKRTTVYAGYGYLDNSGTQIANSNVYSLGGTVQQPGGSSNIIATGLRHSF